MPAINIELIIMVVLSLFVIYFVFKHFSQVATVLVACAVIGVLGWRYMNRAPPNPNDAYFERIKSDREYQL